MKEMLREAHRPTKVKRMGWALIADEITEDGEGNLVDPKAEYEIMTTQADLAVKVNHDRAIKRIIKASKTKEEVENKLAEYLVKFGKPKEEIKEKKFE